MHIAQCENRNRHEKTLQIQEELQKLKNREETYYWKKILSDLPRIPPGVQDHISDTPLVEDSPEFSAVSNMFLKSMVRHRVSFRSEEWAPCMDVTVVEIRKLVHAPLQRRYEAEIAKVAHVQQSHDCTDIPGINAVKCEKHIGLPDLNEYLLYHGAAFSRAHQILRTGLDPQTGTVTGSGRGTYFAENASKADFYATCDSCGENDRPRSCCNKCGDRYVFIARVLLGQSHVLRAGRNYHDAINAERQENGHRYDSHTALSSAWGGSLDHMEYVTYKEKCLLRWLVRYRHKETCQCHNCLYRGRS